MMFDQDLSRQLKKTRFPKVVENHGSSIGSLRHGRNNLMNLSVDVSPLDKSMESVKRGKRNLLATSFDVLKHSVESKAYKNSSIFALVSPKAGYLVLSTSFDGNRSLPT